MRKETLMPLEDTHVHENIEVFTYQKFYQLIKFSFGAILNFTAKIFFVSILGYVFIIPLYLNYLITHVLILFVSYFYHSKVTFNVKISTDQFVNFIKCVLVFKVVDYLVFTSSVYLFQQFYITAIFISTGVVFLLRFLVFDRYVFNRRGEDD